MGTLRNKVVVISGAASGIGRATAAMFARDGARVVIADVNVAGGQETVAQIVKAGGEATFVQTDVRSTAQVQALMEQAIAAYGRIDVLHNNAAVVRYTKSIDEATEEDWRWVLDVNLTSYFVACKAAAPIMRKQGSGAIVNMASVAALQPSAPYLAYSAAKHGVAGLTRGLAAMLQADGIRVNAICPVGVDTPMLANNSPDIGLLRRTTGILQPEDVARAVRYLATKDGLTGALIAVKTAQGRAVYTRVNEWSDTPVTDVA